MSMYPEALVIAYAAMFLWFLWKVRRAPEGFQDKSGFHYGKPNKRAKGW